jgi:anti-sigma B factor antagonist
MLWPANASRTSGTHPAGFAISEPRRVDHATVIAVEGELDLATAPRLKGPLTDALKDGGREVVVDMSALTFIDSTALRVLVEAQSHQGAPLVIVCSHLNVLRIFKIAAFGGTFEIFSTLEKALEHVRRERHLRI